MALIEDALRHGHTALNEGPPLEARSRRKVDAVVDVSRATVFGRKDDRAGRREILSHDRRLEVVESAHLIAAAVWQPRIGRRVCAERTVIAVVRKAVAVVDEHGLVAELAAAAARVHPDARPGLVLGAGRLLAGGGPA